jgi:effector-binding domain-containing protein
VRIGLPQDAHLTTGRIGQFSESNGYRICGPNREVFLKRPSPDRMEDSVVEMQFPIEKA